MAERNEASEHIAWEKQAERRAAGGLLLVMDTSTSSMTIAVMRGGEVLGERSAHGERNHSVHLLPAVQELLHSLELRPRDLAAIAVGAGPGSYTGVRIAVSAAKTMAWALRVPLLGVSSLAALAAGARRRLSGAGGSWYVPLLNARRGQAFTAVYEDGGDDGGGLAAVAADGVRLVRDWADELRERAAREGRRLVFCGETAGFEEALLLEAAGGPAGGERALVLPHELEARDVGALAAPKWARGETEDVHTFVPNYTQLAEAEVKLLSKQRQGD